MPGSSELSVVTVVALVLGGLAAVVLAVVVAGRDPRRPDPAAGSAKAELSQNPRVRAAPSSSAEIEVPAEVLYPVEMGGPVERF